MAGVVLGKLAFITGAGSGIGRATCKLLAKEGATIIATDIKEKSAYETVNSISQESTNNHLALSIDISQSSSINNALNKILDVYKKPPSIIVNCAGITRDNFLLKLSEADFEEVIDVNLKGTFLIIQTFVKSIIEHNVANTSIINIGSIVGKYGNLGQTNYASSKAGVELITKTAVKELAQYGVRCNTILPGFIKSPMTDAVPDKVKSQFISMIPCRRLGNPEEVAEVIAFLASDKSLYVNGASIEITGGF